MTSDTGNDSKPPASIEDALDMLCLASDLWNDTTAARSIPGTKLQQRKRARVIMDTLTKSQYWED